MDVVRRWFEEHVWARDLRGASLGARLWFSFLKVVAHAVSNFERHEIGIRAGGLTLVTMLALVPSLAFAFGIAGGLGYRELLTQAIEENTRGWPPDLVEFVASVRGLVDRTSFSALGWVSSLILAYSAFSLFLRVEDSLNNAWNATVQRTWLRRASDFISLIVVVPLLVLGAFVLASALQNASWIEALRGALPLFSGLFDVGIGFVPHVMAWVAFIALFKFMPSTTVEWRPALVAGVATGSVMIVTFDVYLGFQIGAARMNAIYATLAALPLLLVYLQVAWTIVLLGAETSYAVQHLGAIGPGRRVEDLGWATRERLALKLVERASERFERGLGPIDLARLAVELDAPREWLDLLVPDLERAGLVVQTRRGGRVTPGRPGAQTSVEDVRRAVRGELPRGLAERLALRGELDSEIAAAEDAATERLKRVRFDEQ